MKHAVTAGISLMVLLACGCNMHPLGGDFSQFKLDAKDHFVLSGGYLLPAKEGNYYSYMHGGFIDMVDHMQKLPGKPARRALEIESDDADRRLLRTVRTEPILSGPYGIVSLQKACFFSHAGYNSYLNVDSAMDTRYDIGLPAAKLTSLPASHLTSVSLIRIFAEDGNYTMAVGDYNANGELGGEGISRVKPGGEQISASTGIAVGVPGVPDLSRYKLPRKLTIQEPTDPRQFGLQVSNAAEVVTALVLRYDFDRYLRVDTYAAQQHIATSLLVPTVLPEDVSLDERCNAGLRSQAASGVTVVR